MLYRTIALKDMITKFGKSEAQTSLSEFSCPKNKDIEYFMHVKAVPFENSGLSRTYLVVAQDDNGIYGVCAMYSLSTKQIDSNKKLTAGTRKKLYGTTYSLGKTANAILIGQLSKNYRNGADKHITGAILMSLIYEKIKQMDVVVPSVSVYVECEDIPELRSYYERYGFSLFSTNEDGLLQYLIPTRTFVSAEYKKRHIKHSKVPSSTL